MVSSSGDEIAIPSSKKGIALIALGALALELSSGYLLWIHEESSGITSYFVAGVALAGIVFFGLCAIYAFRKLFDNSPGLVVSAAGIFDNSSGVSAGLIQWSEIKGIRVIEVNFQRFLSIDVRTPDSYIDRGNMLQRMLKRANAKLYGSPIQISTSALRISFDELLEIIDKGRSEYLRR